MTAQELIEKLKTFDPNTRVMVKGYEDGYDDITEINETKVVLNYFDEWYYGKHQDVKHVESETNNETINAIILE